MMNPVVHFELPADDRKRMADFYSKAFGWKATMLGDGMGAYTLVQTGEGDDKGFPTKPGRINGGLYMRDAAKPAQHPSLVLATDDITAAMARVTEAGGKVLGDVKHPLNSSDFSSFLLQAQASKAKVVALANAGGDTTNALKQAAEFGLT